MVSTRRAIVNIAPGKAEIETIPVQKLESGYISVRPTAWAINPSDVYYLNTDGVEGFRGSVVGTDYAGFVIEIGPGVTRELKVGDRIAGVVIGQNPLQKEEGAYAELISVKADVQLKVPDNMTDVDAATQGVALITMGTGLYQTLGLPFPDPASNPKNSFPIFIYGGSTAMGIAAIQFAKLSGATVITTSSPANTDYTKSLGADHVLDYNSPTLADDVLRIAGGPLQYAFDAHPGETSTSVSAAILSHDGRAKYVSLNPGVEVKVKERNADVKASSVLGHSALGEPWFFQGKHYSPVPDDFEFQKRFIRTVEQLFSEGLLKAPRVYLNRGGSGLQGILHGLKEGRVSAGKLVYTAEEA